ncbi:MAG: LysR family transcriptional regulator [Pseudomonadota bacterium]
MVSQPDWDDLRFFLAIQRNHTIRRAANVLHVSHSTVSRRLDTFEKTLGSRLFDRLPEGFVLTETGEQIKERAERVEAEIRSIERDVLGRDARLSGKIKLTMPPPVAEYLMMPHLLAFQMKYPEIELEIDSSYSRSDLTRRDADIAIRIHSPPEDHLLGRRLPDFGESVYVSKVYAAENTFSGSEASAHWIGWGDMERFPSWVKKSRFPDCSVNLEAPNQLAQLSACKAGFGMAILPCFIGDFDPDLVRVPKAGLYSMRSAWILNHPDLKTTERVRVCVRFLVEAVKSMEDKVSGKAEP